jgi:hypothetical protein
MCTFCSVAQPNTATRLAPRARRRMSSSLVSSRPAIATVGARCRRARVKGGRVASCGGAALLCRARSIPYAVVRRASQRRGGPQRAEVDLTYQASGGTKAVACEEARSRAERQCTWVESVLHLDATLYLRDGSVVRVSPGGCVPCGCSCARIHHVAAGSLSVATSNLPGVLDATRSWAARTARWIECVTARAGTLDTTDPTLSLAECAAESNPSFLPPQGRPWTTNDSSVWPSLHVWICTRDDGG